MVNEFKPRKYRSANDAPFEPPKVDYGESLTVPDQAMSVREILHRYTTGGDLRIKAGTPVYSEDTMLYDTRRKHNIDLAVDRKANEEFVASQRAKVIDNVISENNAKVKARAEAGSKGDSGGQTDAIIPTSAT